MSIIMIISVMYAFLGAMLIFLLNRSKETSDRIQNWTKYGVFIGIVTLIFSFLLLTKLSFIIAGLLVFALSMIEIIRILMKNVMKLKNSVLSFIIYFITMIFFLQFTLMDNRSIVWVFFLVITFDAFSQLVGQLFGKRKLAPGISPKKTYEGLLGGLLFTALSAMVLSQYFDKSIFVALVYSFCISFSALAGDLLASKFKRLNKVKDFGTIIPAHGGVLDRFDSFIMAGSIFWIIT